VTLEELAAKFDTDGDTLIASAKAYRQGCHSEQRGLRIGKGAAFKAAAAALRGVLAQVPALPMDEGDDIPSLF
jgi:hypothetical protein